jgi:hypothetical protein
MFNPLPKKAINKNLSLDHESLTNHGFFSSWFNMLIARRTSKIGGPPNKFEKVALITSPLDHEILFIMHLTLIFHSLTFS